MNANESNMFAVCSVQMVITNQNVPVADTLTSEHRAVEKKLKV